MKIVVGISSGIAAVKVPHLIKTLLACGHEVDVVMTSHAAKMIDPQHISSITGKKVYQSLFDSEFSTEKILKNRKVDHIELAKSADIIVIVPATANFIAKCAYGIADDFLTTMILATTAPLLLCPSMNTNMWQHLTVKQNIAVLRRYGYHILMPTYGDLACGTEGIGRLPDTEVVKNTIESIVAKSNELNGKRIIVTAGGTSEPIDPVRVITNYSSGKMGVAIAHECQRRGAKVLLLKSKNSVDPHFYIPFKEFVTSHDLVTLIEEHIKNCDIIIHTAAVSDFFIEPQLDKLDSHTKQTLLLYPTQKIINSLKKLNENIFLIAFKTIITEDIHTVTSQANEILQSSKADLVVVNNIARHDIGFGSDLNEVYCVDNKLSIVHLKKTSKHIIAEKLLDMIVQKINKIT